MSSSNIRIGKDAPPSKAQVYLSREQTVKRDQSSFLLDWVAGCEALPIRGAHVTSIYEQESIAIDRCR
jgi:hypothetical protein